METVRSDGLVLARNLGYDDWVRLAAATEPIATPPITPTRSTNPTSPAARRRAVEWSRYQTTRVTRLMTASVRSVAHDGGWSKVDNRGRLGVLARLRTAS